MTATMIRNPDANVTAIRFDLPKATAPHVREWHAALKKDGETLDDFLLRQLLLQAVQHVQQKTIATEQATRDVARQADQAALRAETKTLLG